MKKITLLFFLLAVSFGYSQQVLIEDFESSPALHSWSGAAVTVGTDAVSSNGQNMEVTLVAAAGDPWQGAAVTLPAGTVMDLTTDKTVTVDVYSTTALTIMGKVESNSGASASAVDVAHGGAGWQTITFDFASNNQDGTGPANGEYNLFAVFPNRDGAGGWGSPVIGSVTQYDNLTAVLGVPAETCNDGILNNGETEIDCGGPNCDPCPVPPSNPPTNPPARDPMNVKSVYSNAYTQSPTDGYQTFGGSVVSEIDFSGNTILSATSPVSGAGFQYQYFGVTPQYLDLSSMTHMHIDFYFEGAPATAGTVFIVIAQYSDGTNIQKNFDVTALASNTWHEMDVAFADFDGNPTYSRDQIQQVIVQTAGPDVYGPFYVDNLYFHNNTVLSTDDFETTQFSVYPNPSNNVWNIKTNNIVINSVQVFDILGKQVISLNPNSEEVEIDASTLTSGLYFAKLATESGSSSIKLIKN